MTLAKIVESEIARLEDSKVGNGFADCVIEQEIEDLKKKLNEIERNT